MFAHKKDGSLHLCVDYFRLNAVTVRDLFTLSRMDKYIYSLGDAIVFSTLNDISRNWQIEIDEPDRDKTAFSERHGL